MKQHFPTAVFCGFFAFAAVTAAGAQSIPERTAVEAIAGLDHRTSDLFLDTGSAGAGIRAGVLLGSNFRLLAGLSRDFSRLFEEKERRDGTDRRTSYSLTAAWDIGRAHEVSLGYLYNRYELAWQAAPGLRTIGESESVSLDYSHFADWGQAGIGVTEILGNGSDPFLRVNGEYKLAGLGGQTEFYALGGAYGAVDEDDKGFSLGLRAKMPKGYNLYASAGRSYFSSGGDSTGFSLALVKSFGANAERIFRRH
ncbi:MULTISPECIES: hypothetical protein [Leisingera]|uniref:hypothetical protein n=1 Tax=Leisingera TaxID=191028 RepID=UPI001154B604|nr:MULTISPECIES: hypothetical protein [Leisingera]QDI76911.1 hypothetical protein R2C4_14545 [Leisingera aquaemixtae]